MTGLLALAVAETASAMPTPEKLHALQKDHDYWAWKCKHDDLTKREQRTCDRIRFAGDEHYIVARIAPNGGVRSYHLLRTKTGEEVVTAYPFGLSRAIATDHRLEREVSIRHKNLNRFLKKRPVPDMRTKKRPLKKDARLTLQQTSGNSFFPAIGLELGWSPSTGQSTTECIEFTVAPPNGIAVQTSFSSEDQANSTAEQINISATVKGSYGAFSASDTFSYSDSYQASANSGFQYWNLANLYTLNTAASTTNPFTNQGQGALDAGSFYATCGSEYMTSVMGGFYATISMGWNSSSSSTSQTISDSFTANYGLDSLTAAASVTTSSSDSQSAFKLTMTIYGGGSAPSGTGKLAPSVILTNAFASGDSEGSYYVRCAGTTVNPPAPNPDACTQFSSAMATGSSNASGAFTEWVNGLGAGSNLSAFALFPSGVAGENPGIETLPMPTPTVTNDILTSYKNQLVQYMDLTNQLATLENRASYLSKSINQTTYDPANTQLQLSLSGVLNLLETNYHTDKQNTFVKNLGACLQATASNVTTVCQPILDNQFTTPYDFYQSSSKPNKQLLLQNTIALQYSGIFTNNNGSQWPQDVVYFNPLPAWNINQFVLIKNQAALIGFANAAYVNAGNTQVTPSLSFLPLYPSADIQEVTTQVYTTQGTNSPGLWFGWLNNTPSPGTNDLTQPLSWLGGTSFCFPTAQNPCEIWFGINNNLAPDYPISFKMDPIPNLFPSAGN